MSETTLIVDMNNLSHAARHAMGQLSFDDTPTAVTYGVLSRLLSLGQRYATNQMILCWDSPISKRVDTVWGLYKAGRREKKAGRDEQQARIEAFKEMVRLHHNILPRIGFNNSRKAEGYEADDLIAKQCLDTIEDVVIVSDDNDLWQCLAANVRQLHLRSGKVMTMAKFVSTYGLQPLDWGEVKALAGCSSDGVPGIAGIGEENAVKYLRGELTKGKRYESIVEQLDSREVETWRRLVYLPFEDLVCAPQWPLNTDTFSLTEFENVCEQYGFESFLRNIAAWEAFFKGEFDDEPKRQSRATEKVRKAMRRKG